jgi:hypothetical protein
MLCCFMGNASSEHLEASPIERPQTVASLFHIEIDHWIRHPNFTFYVKRTPNNEKWSSQYDEENHGGGGCGDGRLLKVIVISIRFVWKKKAQFRRTQECKSARKLLQDITANTLWGGKRERGWEEHYSAAYHVNVEHGIYSGHEQCSIAWMFMN